MIRRILNHPTAQGLVRTALVLLVLPYGLALLYSFIHPPSTLMLGRMLTFRPVEREWVTLDRISPQAIAAVVAAEDGAFCQHFGLDFKQLEYAAAEVAEGKAARGASTITMQTAKNLFLWNGRSWLRKGLEAPLSVWLEVLWPKQRVLEVYLNVAEWGEGIFGIEAAAQHYFGVPAHTLSLHQAALLASTLPNPSARSPVKPGPAQSGHASLIEARVINHTPDLSCLKR